MYVFKSQSETKKNIAENFFLAKYIGNFSPSIYHRDAGSYEDIRTGPHHVFLLKLFREKAISCSLSNQF